MFPQMGENRAENSKKTRSTNRYRLTTGDNQPILPALTVFTRCDCCGTVYHHV